MWVNEIFGPTIQGEGKSTGRPVMFIRMAGCNLACIWCDTPYTWNWVGTKFVHPEKFRPSDESHRTSIEDILTILEVLGPDTRSVVISGGEPMLQMQELVGLVKELKGRGYWVEVETNGTITPSVEFLELVDQVNCSPKLANSGPDNPEHKRLVETALTTLASSPNVTFKFVVASDEDIPQILDLVSRFRMEQVYLMPLGKTREEQEHRQAQVADLCHRYQFNFSSRLHVLLWGTKRAV